ncbi:MAG: hypothetical protein HY074_10360 [Deltaproteobacteria bacterium]|nr:hypothetical protein [Deltaproteobacteria bacterium]
MKSFWLVLVWLDGDELAPDGVRQSRGLGELVVGGNEPYRLPCLACMFLGQTPDGSCIGCFAHGLAH